MDREARIAARVAARQNWTPIVPGPRDAVAWRNMSLVLRTHAGLASVRRMSHRMLNQVLGSSGVPVVGWDEAVEDGDVDAIDGYTDLVVAAGWRVKVGPRGGAEIVRRPTR